MSDALKDLAGLIESTRADAVVSTEITNGELTIHATLNSVPGLIGFLKSDPVCQFSTLVDITAVDFPTRERRFEVVYHLLSMYQNQRVRVKASLREGDLVPSITDIYPAANWFEREVYDMYGLMFSGHPDLRRLLTDYGFRGHPLRKDFPTTGYTEVRYDEKEKRVVYEPVSLVQEYRQFDFMSPWEGAEYILPAKEGEARD